MKQPPRQSYEDKITSEESASLHAMEEDAESKLLPQRFTETGPLPTLPYSPFESCHG